MERAPDVRSETDHYRAYNGDCCEILSELAASSVGLSVFSPPFADLYSYSNDERDLGNSRGYDEFFQHFEYVVAELARVMMPGRMVAVHCMDIPAMKERDGYIGLKDFPGDMIRCFQGHGFIYHSRVTIWKDPLVEATRTKALGLAHKQLVKDSAMCRVGLPDYLVSMRKSGDNPVPIRHLEGLTRYVGTDEITAPHGKRPPRDNAAYAKKQSYVGGPVFSHQAWRKYASPVWMDINQSNTLNRDPARGENDEKHICPLQLDVIERAVELWSTPGDTVLSPFMGIGSEGYVALRNGRRFVGVELKPEYYRVAIQNLDRAVEDAQKGQGDLFANVE